MYVLGGTSHDFELRHTRRPEAFPRNRSSGGRSGDGRRCQHAASVGEHPSVSQHGRRSICISGGKHMRGPQCSGILAGRRDLVQAAWLNSSPHSDALGRPMKVGREEMVTAWLTVEKHSRLDFDAIDRAVRQTSRVSRTGALVRPRPQAGTDPGGPDTQYSPRHGPVGRASAGNHDGRSDAPADGGNASDRRRPSEEARNRAHRLHERSWR